MFTGIIQAIGAVVRVEVRARGDSAGTRAHRLELDLGALADGLTVGASVAVNGACLTYAGGHGTHGVFDVVPETWHRTTLRELRAGMPVNLERSLRVGEPIDGHFVQGHVEGVGTVARVERGAGEWKLHVALEAGLLKAIVPKGSVAIDGVSLTVVDVGDDSFSVALVPTTLERTTLGRRRPGEHVNVETDILARIVLHRLQPARSDGMSTWDTLRDGGYLT